MATAQMKFGLNPFCYEHHVQMNQILSTANEVSAQSVTFGCPEPGCLVHYRSSKGYFLLAHDEKGNGSNPESGPRVRCKEDGAPMYLSEFLPQRPTLRLWKCPLCGFLRATHDVPAASPCEVSQNGAPKIGRIN